MEQELNVPKGDDDTADDSRGCVRIAGPSGLGKKQTARALEGGL